MNAMVMFLIIYVECVQNVGGETGGEDSREDNER